MTCAVLQPLVDGYFHIRDQPPEGKAREPRVEFVPITKHADNPLAFKKVDILEVELAPRFFFPQLVREAVKVPIERCTAFSERDVLEGRERERRPNGDIILEHATEPCGDAVLYRRRPHPRAAHLDELRDILVDLDQQPSVLQRDHQRQDPRVELQLTAEAVSPFLRRHSPHYVCDEPGRTPPQRDVLDEKLFAGLQGLVEVPGDVFRFLFEGVELPASQWDDFLDSFQHSLERFDVVTEVDVSLI